MRTVNVMPAFPRPARPRSACLLVFGRRELAGFFLEHHRNAVADRIGEPRRLRYQFHLLAVERQWPLGDGADKHFNQLRIHGSFPPRARRAPGRSPRAWRKRSVDPKLIEMLVCPVTKGPLTFDREKMELISKSARLAYPVRDGIPVMLEEEARKLTPAEYE